MTPFELLEAASPEVTLFLLVAAYLFGVGTRTFVDAFLRYARAHGRNPE